MKAQLNTVDQLEDDLHVRDQITHALYLKLKSERETREALLDAAQSGAAPEVLEAIASDPVPIIDDFGREKTVLGLVERYIMRSCGRSVEKIGAGR